MIQSLLLLILIIIVLNQQIDICTEVIEASKMNRLEHIQLLITKIENKQHAPCILQLIPKYVWAQNLSHIMVNFQFTNSAYTSACEKVLKVTKNIGYDNISLSLICIQGQLLIRYRLEIKTFMPMNYYQAIWKQTSQNGIVLECMKSPNPYFWKKLYNDKFKPKKIPKIWWKQLQKFKEDLAKFIGDLQIQQQQYDISNYVRKTKRSKRLDGDSDINFYCNQENPYYLGSWL